MSSSLDWIASHEIPRNVYTCTHYTLATAFRDHVDILHCMYTRALEYNSTGNFNIITVVLCALVGKNVVLPANDQPYVFLTFPRLARGPTIYRTKATAFLQLPCYLQTQTVQIKHCSMLSTVNLQPH